MWIVIFICCLCVWSSDVDECAVENGGCAHICNNNPGSYNCLCYDGYEQDCDGRACSGEHMSTAYSTRVGGAFCSSLDVVFHMLFLTIYSRCQRV